MLASMAVMCANKFIKMNIRVFYFFCRLLINDQVIPAGNVALYKFLVLHSGYCNKEGVYYKIEEAIKVCTWENTERIYIKD